MSMLFENGPCFTITRLPCFPPLIHAFPACSSRKSKFPVFLMTTRSQAIEMRTYPVQLTTKIPENVPWKRPKQPHPSSCLGLTAKHPVLVVIPWESHKSPLIELLTASVNIANPMEENAARSPIESLAVTPSAILVCFTSGGTSSKSGLRVHVLQRTIGNPRCAILAQDVTNDYLPEQPPALQYW